MGGKDLSSMATFHETPGVHDGVCWLEVRNVRSIVGRSFFNPVVFFDDSVFSDNDSRSSEEIYKVKWACGDVTAFV